MKQRLADIEKTLPDGVKIVPLYDRTGLIHRTIHTVTRNLIEGGLSLSQFFFFCWGVYEQA